MCKTTNQNFWMDGSRASFLVPGYSPSKSYIELIGKLLLEHVGLPHVLDQAVHLVNFFGWMNQGGHSERLLLLALFY